MVLQNSPELNSTDKDEYKCCSFCIMDNQNDPDINFDSKGQCNYCRNYYKLEKETVVKGKEGLSLLNNTFNQIKSEGKNKKYDCLLGVSGGVDSSYLAYLAKKEGLRPLLVHFDNGWNSELAVSNIHNLTESLGLDLYTYVMDWQEFKSIQRSYFKASVIDIEIPTDQLIFGALIDLAKKNRIKYILSGWNTVTEGIMPQSWYYPRKFDSHNLIDIHRSQGGKVPKKLPLVGFWKYAYNLVFGKIVMVSPLNWIDYDKSRIKQFLSTECGWRDYGGKHYESVFTRFYQGYVLPVKFNVDKRRAHLSTLICSGQITREQALSEISLPTYDKDLQEQDKEYVCKKLGFTLKEFDDILNSPKRSHYEFKNDEKLFQNYLKFLKLISPFKSTIKRLLK